MSQFGFAMGDGPAHRIPVWKLLAAFAGLLGVLAFVVFRSFGGPADFEPETQGPEVAVTVNAGDTLSAIGRALKDAGVIASVDAFVQASEANPESRYITPGDYKVATHIPAATAIKLLLSPEARDEVKLVVPEGTRAAEIYALIAEKFALDADSVQQVFKSAELPASADGTPEGYLFPATYGIKRSATAEDIAKQMIARFRQAAAELELERRARAQQMTVHDVMTLASLLEGEAAPKDYAKVARVILNRLAKNMPLQLDSTVNYGMGADFLQLTNQQLQKDGPYNTYTRTGLPPTPINNPGAAAIEAALSPVRGDWLYFVTTDPKNKVTEFAVTYEDFLKLKAKFKRAIA